MNLKSSAVLKSDIPLGPVWKNIGSLFLHNLEKYPKLNAFAERLNGDYIYYNWDQVANSVFHFAEYLFDHGVKHHDRVAIIAGNTYRRFIVEMGIFSAGMTSVPLFGGYPGEMLTKLIEFSKVRMLIVDDLDRLKTLDPKVIPPMVLCLSNKKDFTSSTQVKIHFWEELAAKLLSPMSASMMSRIRGVKPSDVAVMMYTSGTSAFPKGVQLTHSNILSQQRALELLWKCEPGQRVLCYLPWHHSFGGLFERFFVIGSAGCLALDDSAGKNIDRLLENFGKIKPNVYFSVPKIYQEIIARVLSFKEIEKTFFHPELNFIFTAAAPLPLSISDVFKAKGVPVVEGWGLTETSPCCTLTPKSVNRVQGVVGHAIPGVEVKLGDQNEILVRGPNIMVGYWEQPEMTAEVLDSDGWFKTGDIGEITPEGLKILSRKDRMFKLNNGEKIFPSILEEHVKTGCKFVKHAFVFGKGQVSPFLLVFPNSELLSANRSADLDESNCIYPTDLRNFSGCLGRCLTKFNDDFAKIERIERALIINRELTIEQGELTPSFKLVPRRIAENYRDYISAMEDGRLNELPKDSYVIELKSR